MNCTLTLKQQKLLFGKVAIDLKNNPSFDFNSYAKGFYDLINNQTKDPILAANYVALLPMNIRAASGVSRDLYRKLATYAGQIADLEAQFEDFNKVQAFVTGLQTEAQDIVKLANDIQKESLTELPEPVNIISIPAEVQGVSLWDLNFDVSKEGELKPEMALYTNVKKQLIANKKDDGTSVVDGKPVKMMITSTADFKPTDFYPNIEAAVLAGDQRIIDFNKKGIALIVTDLEGKPVYFNPEQKISSEGKPAYYIFKAPKKVASGAYVFDFNEKAYVGQLQRQRGFTQEQAEALLNKQNIVFEKIRTTILADPSTKLDVMITGGFSNIILKPTPQQLTIGNVFDFQGKAFKPYKGPEGKENIYFFDYPGAQGNFVINKPKVPDAIITKLVQLLSENVLTRNGTPLRVTDKIALFKQFVHIDPAILSLTATPAGALQVQKLGRTITYPNKEAMSADLLSILRNNILTRELSATQVEAKQKNGSQIVTEIKGSPYGSIYVHNDNNKLKYFEVGPLQLKIDKIAAETNKFKDFTLVVKDDNFTITVEDKPYYPFIQENFLIDAKQYPKTVGETLEFSLAPQVGVDIIKKDNNQPELFNDEGNLKPENFEKKTDNKTSGINEDFIKPIIITKNNQKNIKNELQNILSGNGKVSHGTTIQATLTYLRGKEGPISSSKRSKQISEEENKKLREYILDKKLWYNTDKLQYLGEGQEQKVYADKDSNYVIKVNDINFYGNWSDYLDSLLLHNYLFPNTAYELIGFKEVAGKIHAIVKQPFVVSTKIVDLSEVEIFLKNNGFIKDDQLSNDYYNPELGIRLEDLHDENVLVTNDVFQFIDTIFYTDNTFNVKEEIDRKDWLLGRTELFKGKSQEQVQATLDQIDAANKWYKSNPLSNYFPFETAFDVVNKQSSNNIARWTTSGITLFKGADYSDLYHEAWHGFTQGFLSKDEKTDLYDEAKKLSGSFSDYAGNSVKFKDATDLQIEEYLAEDFREYMLSDGKRVLKTSPVRNSVFRRILNFLKELFGSADVKQTVIDEKVNKKVSELYNKLRVGDLSAYTFAAENRNYDTLNKALQSINPSEVEKSLSFENSNIIYNAVNSLFSEAVDVLNQSNLTKIERERFLQSKVDITPEEKIQLDKLKTQAISNYTTVMVSTTKGIKTLYNYAKFGLENKLAALIKVENPSPEVQKQKDLLEYAIRNFGDIENLGNNKPEEGVVGYHFFKSDLIDEQVFDEIAEDEENAERELEGKNYFDRGGNEKSPFESASKEIINLLKSLHQTDQNGVVLNDIFGFPRLLNDKAAFAHILRLVENSKDLTEMVDRLQKESENYYPIGQLLQKMGPVYSENQTARETDLWSKFYQTFNKYRQPLVQTTVNKTVIRDDMSGEVIETSYDIKIGNALADTNKTDQDWRSQFSKENENPLIKNDLKGNWLDATELLKLYPSMTEVNADPMKFLSDIGIKMANIPVVKDEVEKAIKSGNIRLSGIYNNITKLNEGGIVIRNIGTYLTANPRLQIKGLVGQTGPNSNYGKLLTIQTKYSSDYSDFMVQNAAGDPQSEYTLNSSLTQIIKQINSVPSYVELVNNPATAQYNNTKGVAGRPYNPFVNSSIWFNALFDMNSMGGEKRDNELTIDNLSGINSSVNDGVFKEGVALSQADEVGKLLSDFHTQLMKFTPELTRHAGKKTSLAVYLRNYYTGAKNKRLYIDTESFVNTDQISSGVESFQKQLITYMGAELDRVNYAKELLADPSVTQTDFNYLKRGSKFVAFAGVLSENSKEQLYNIKGNLTDYLNSDAGLNLDNQIRQEILTYFSKLVDGVQNKMSANGFLSPTLIERVRQDAKKDGISDLSLTEPIVTRALASSFVANNWIHHFEEMITLYGDIALYKDFFKRNASLNSTGDIIRNDDAFIKTVNEKLGKGFTQQLGITMEDRPYTGQFNAAIVSDVLVKSAYLDKLKAASTSHTIEEKYGDNGINEADAQGLIAFDAYRIVLKSLGKWSTIQEGAYQDLLAGKPAEEISVDEMFPTLKMGYYGPVQSDYLPLTGLHKFALFPLIPGVIPENLQELHEKMMRENIDYLTFESGSKVATISDKSGMQPFYSDVATRTLNTAPFVKNPVFPEYLKYQVENAPYYKGKVTLATQLRKLADIGLTEEGVPTDFVGDARFKDRESAWESLNETQKKLASNNYTLRANYLKALNDLVAAQKNKLLADIGWKQNKDGSVSGDLSSLLELISNELKRGDVGDHEWAYIQTIKGNDIKNDLDLSTSADIIEKVIVSLVNKRLINLKVKGEQLVLVSTTGFEDKAFTNQGDRNFEKPSEADLAKYGTNDLPSYYIGGNGLIQAAKVKISLQGDFKKLLKHPDVIAKAEQLTISPFQALNLLIKDNDWLNEDDNRYLVTMVGARIPTQGINSAEFVEVYEFLPEIAGNIIIAPSEITSKGGSDFDFDKLPLMMPNITITDNGKIILSKGGTPSIENDLIKSLRSILEQPSNFEALITPNDTNLVKPLADTIYETENGKDAKALDKQGTKMFEPLHNIKVQQANSIGKDTLGIGAIYNTFNSVFNAIGLTLNSQYGSGKNISRAVLMFPHNKKAGNISLSSLKDADNVNSISEVVSQLINGWVDVEKDDWISYIQGNKEIAPVMLFMLRAGVPIEQVVYFVTQPVIKQYVAAQREAKSSFAEPLGYSIAETKTAKKTARNEVLRQFGFEGASLAELIYAAELYVTDEFTLDQLKNSTRNNEPGLVAAQSQGPVLQSFAEINTPSSKTLTRDEIINLFVKASSEKEVKLIYKKLQIKYHPDKEGGDLETSKLINTVYDEGKDVGFNLLQAGMTRRDVVEKQYNKQREFDFAVFLHFLEIENMSKEVDKVQRAFNVDTTRLQNLNDFYSKISEIEELDSNSLIPQKFIKRMKENTAIGPFYIQEFALSIFDKVLPLRTNELLNKHMLTLLPESKKLFKDDETAMKTFKDDFLNYIFQQTTRNYLPIEGDEVGDTVLPDVDIFSNSNERYHFNNERRKLATQFPLNQISADIDYNEMVRENYRNDDLRKEDQTPEEFLKFIEDLSYEQWLNEKALFNILNPYQIFKSRFGMAGKYSFIINKYPQLKENFSLLSNIKTSSKDGLNNIQLSTMKLTKDEIDVFHENFKDLGNSNKLLKIPGITQRDADYISDFFDKLPLYLYMQSGPNTRNPFSFNRIMPNEKIVRILEEPVNNLSSNMTTEFLEKYEQAFIQANTKTDTRARFKDYLASDFPLNTSENETQIVNEEVQDDVNAATQTPENSLPLEPKIVTDEDLDDLINNCKK